MFDYRQACFLTSVASIRGLPADRGREVAFAGRSNAGKSSAINALTGRRHLARTSRTPGRTRLINFFELDEERRLVDLPGYGYAKVPRSMSREWGALVGKYLESRESLAGVVVLMDIRHPLTELDATLLDWCRAADLPVLAVLTKADKLARGRRAAALAEAPDRPARKSGAPRPLRRRDACDGVLGDEADRMPGTRGVPGRLAAVRTAGRKHRIVPPGRKRRV